MRAIVAMTTLALSACGAARTPLPDLPPPEYETPRGYDLGGGAKAAPSAVPDAPKAPPSDPKPAPSPSATPSAAPPPKR